MRKLFLFLSLFTVLMTIHLFPEVIATFRDFKYPHRFYLEGDRIYINEGTKLIVSTFLSNASSIFMDVKIGLLFKSVRKSLS